MWSFVKTKQQERWLWHAIDHHTGEVLACVVSNHQDSYEFGLDI
jgi:insertion element IS1 protein InsB